jgi:hypothetical protein
MPCNGVSVATARVAQDTQKFLAILPQEAVDKAVVAFLKQIGYPQAQSFYKGEVNLGNSRYLYLDDLNRIFVDGNDRSLLAQVNGFLDTLAGRIRQNVIWQALQKQGVKITNQQTASNGAIVLSVEI